MAAPRPTDWRYGAFVPPTAPCNQFFVKTKIKGIASHTLPLKSGESQGRSSKFAAPWRSGSLSRVPPFQAHYFYPSANSHAKADPTGFNRL